MFQRADEVVLLLTRLDIYIFVVVFILFASLLSAFAVIIDKKLAQKHKNRISEKALFTLAIFGGALCEYVVMNFMRHKTLHKRFMIGLPIIFCIQIALFTWFTLAWF